MTADRKTVTGYVFVYQNRDGVTTIVSEDDANIYEKYHNDFRRRDVGKFEPNEMGQQVIRTSRR